MPGGWYIEEMALGQIRKQHRKDVERSFSAPLVPCRTTADIDPGHQGQAQPDLFGVDFDSERISIDLNEALRLSIKTIVIFGQRPSMGAWLG